MLHCAINISEGCSVQVVGQLTERAGPAVIDVHRDADHNRSVLTLAGADDIVEEAARRLATAVVANVDLTDHRGAHPRLGALDVVPWVHLVADRHAKLEDGRMKVAVEARDRFADWAGTELELPCFVYGPAAAHSPTAARSLPELRRSAWRPLVPDTGPLRPHPTAGAVCVGARPLLVAYNLWLARPDIVAARRIAADLRSPQVRTLGLRVGDQVQVSCNLIDPWQVGPAAAFDFVATRAEVRRAELVGLLPLGVLEAIPSRRWALLDVDISRTIEARL